MSVQRNASASGPVLGAGLYSSISSSLTGLEQAFLRSSADIHLFGCDSLDPDPVWIRVSHIWTADLSLEGTRCFPLVSTLCDHSCSISWEPPCALQLWPSCLCDKWRVYDHSLTGNHWRDGSIYVTHSFYLENFMTMLFSLELRAIKSYPQLRSL